MRILAHRRFIFGEHIHPHTQAVNSIFGGGNPKGTKIFFTDFSDDPWSETTVDDEGAMPCPEVLISN